MIEMVPRPVHLPSSQGLGQTGRSPRGPDSYACLGDLSLEQGRHVLAPWSSLPRPPPAGCSAKQHFQGFRRCHSEKGILLFFKKL